MAFSWKLSLNTLRESWLPSFSSLPLVGEITEGEVGGEDLLTSLLGNLTAEALNHAQSVFLHQSE
jgi:hypothetical protein